MGAPKAGTTTLARDLARHPDVWLPARKELRFWVRENALDVLGEYEAHFADAPDDAVIGEATPTYLHTPGALERIAAAMPAARLVVLVRDPVDRFWSHYWYNRLARRAERRPPDVALTEDPDQYVEPGRYAPHLRRALTLFEPAQLLVVVLDDLAAEPAVTYRLVCRHLGVAETVPAGVGTVQNAAYELRSIRLREQMIRHQVWRRFPRLGERLERWNRRPTATPAMPADLRHRLRAIYADDDADLAAVLHRSLPWVSR